MASEPNLKEMKNAEIRFKLRNFWTCNCLLECVFFTLCFRQILTPNQGPGDDGKLCGLMEPPIQEDLAWSNRDSEVQPSDPKHLDLSVGDTHQQCQEDPDTCTDPLNNRGRSGCASFSCTCRQGKKGMLEDWHFH